jgi:hypothetical protein
VVKGEVDRHGGDGEEGAGNPQGAAEAGELAEGASEQGAGGEAAHDEEPHGGGDAAEGMIGAALLAQAAVGDGVDELAGATAVSPAC